MGNDVLDVILTLEPKAVILERSDRIGEESRPEA